jgi:uncharacterized damage-inducible protein DinB
MGWQPASGYRFRAIWIMCEPRRSYYGFWDEATEKLNAIWPTIPAHRFAEVDKAFGQWENSGINTILYGIDNEIHHRGQGFVYLRALGLEPPSFWER